MNWCKFIIIYFLLFLSIEDLIFEAHKLYSLWQDSPSKELADRVAAMYSSAAVDMSSALAQAHASFDIYAIYIGTLLAIQVSIFKCVLCAFGKFGFKQLVLCFLFVYTYII